MFFEHDTCGKYIKIENNNKSLFSSESKNISRDLNTSLKISNT